ncbi:MAG: radical SAM protein [Bacillota bacterium]|nr:radical SAM protein [Bacillota bacterium]
MSISYKPITGVWEITMGCNLRCKHCGSSCENPLADELSTKEALKLCDDLAEIGFQWLTLSGGEPTTRKDWDIIAKRLNDNGIIPNMITNGWLINDEIAKRAKAAGVNTVAISLDGLEKTHDYIRREGSYARIMKAIDVLVDNGVNCSIITTVNKMNLSELPQMYELLSGKGIYGWQFQLGLPMGNMAKNNELVAEPRHVDDVINFAYEAMLKGGIDIQLADCMGYFNQKEIETRKKSNFSNEYNWNGCGAGKYVLGILNNGDIVGCTSIRDREFIEGNIKVTPIKEIWNDPNKFTWNRNITKEMLSGTCKKCLYGNRCHGGCGNTRLTMEGTVYGQNKYCSYHLAVKKAEEQFENINDMDLLLSKAEKFAKSNNHQLTEILLSKALSIDPENETTLSLYGFTAFMLENYHDAMAVNKKLLEKNSQNAYANKGYGLSIARLGMVDEGISYLRKAIDITHKKYLDPFFDMAVILYENGRIKEALNALEEGRSVSEDFKASSEVFYNQLKEVLA